MWISQFPGKSKGVSRKVVEELLTEKILAPMDIIIVNYIQNFQKKLLLFQHTNFYVTVKNGMILNCM